MNTASKNKPTWQQDEISLKFFSSTTVLLSGLMRFTSKRPTCKTQKYNTVRQTRGRPHTEDNLSVKCVMTKTVTILRPIQWHTQTNSRTLEIRVNKSAPTIFPIIDCYVEYHIERCALVFKISHMREWAWCTRNGSWLTLQPACFSWSNSLTVSEE